MTVNLFSNQAKTNWRHEHGINEDAFLLVYAGIIGHAQGLEILVKAASMLSKNPRIHFLILGSGPLREDLIAKATELELKNITFAEAVGKSRMPEILACCDASIIPLKKLDLFKGAIPSKIFEVLAMKKPILLGVDGEAKELFITQGKAGIYFTPENCDELVRGILDLSDEPDLCKKLGENGYAFVEANFTRDMIAEKFLEHLKKPDKANN